MHLRGALTHFLTHFMSLQFWTDKRISSLRKDGDNNVNYDVSENCRMKWLSIFRMLPHLETSIHAQFSASNLLLKIGTKCNYSSNFAYFLISYNPIHLARHFLSENYSSEYFLLYSWFIAMHSHLRVIFTPQFPWGTSISAQERIAKIVNDSWLLREEPGTMCAIFFKEKQYATLVVLCIYSSAHEIFTNCKFRSYLLSIHFIFYFYAYCIVRISTAPFPSLVTTSVHCFSVVAQCSLLEMSCFLFWPDWMGGSASLFLWFNQPLSLSCLLHSILRSRELKRAHRVKRARRLWRLREPPSFFYFLWALAPPPTQKSEGTRVTLPVVTL